MSKFLMLALVCMGFVLQAASVQAEDQNMNSLLISETTYKNLPSREQKKYIREARKHYYEFETVLNKDMKFVEASYNKYQFAIALLMDNASAEVENAFCVAGGQKLTLSSSKICLLKEQECEYEGSKGFLCGGIFSNKCVDARDATVVSKLCYERSKGLEIPPANYPGMIEHYNSIYQDVCVNDNSLAKLAQEHVAACHYLRVKMDKLNEPLEKKLRAELDACKQENESLVSLNSTLTEDLKRCQDQLPKPNAADIPSSPSFKCEMTGGRINSGNLSNIRGVPIFNSDRKMRKLLEGTPSNIKSIAVSYDAKDGACFDFKIKKYAKNYAGFSDDEVVTNPKDVQFKKCTKASLLNSNGTLSVSALPTRRNDAITFDQKCRLLPDRINSKVPRGTASVEE